MSTKQTDIRKGIPPLPNNYQRQKNIQDILLTRDDSDSKPHSRGTATERFDPSTFTQSVEDEKKNTYIAELLAQKPWL